MARLLERGNVALHLSELELLRRFKSPVHKIVFYRHPDLGRVLMLDGEVQHVEAWVPLYHEPLVHLPAAFIHRPRTALLLGGGSLFAARELLKYRSIERVLMLDHDQDLVAAVCDLYEHARDVVRDPRLEIRAEDAFSALTQIPERFDLVINDAVDLLKVRKRDIFSAMSLALTPGGVCSDIVYRHVFDDAYLSRTAQSLRSRYFTAFSLVFVPEYPGVLHVLTMWGGNRSLRQNRRQTLNCEQQEWASLPLSNPCVYFDSRFLPYYLHLPRYLREKLGDTTT